MLLDVSAALLLLVSAIALFYLYRKKKQEVLDKLGLPIAGEPNVLFGSLLDFRGHTMSSRLMSWTKQHGKTYGYYEGPNAVIVSSDLDFLQEIFVKQFGCFNGRKLYSLQGDPDKEPHVHMFLAKNERWKRLRLCANPAFSTGKMKQMFPTVNACESRLMARMNEQATSGGTFNVHELYQRLTLDVIFECAFGVSINVLDNPVNAFLQKVRQAFSGGGVPVALVLGMIFWELRRALRFMYGVLLKAGLLHSPFRDMVVQLIPHLVKVRQEQQRSRGDKDKDLIQLMLDAMEANDAKANGPNVVKSHEMSLKEVESQVQLFMLAGYETSSTALAYCSYLLSTHPEVQVRLQKEIDAFYDSEFTSSASEKDEELTYDRLVNSDKLPYLDMVINETLRMYPIASNVLTRTCYKETEVRGMKIPAGISVIPDVWSVHYDPEIWGPEDPQKFCPERFAPELHDSRHPLSFLAFGAGPRNCIGMRFALMEIKLTLVRLLRHYTIEECERTEKPLQLRERDVIAPKNGVYVRLQTRKCAE